MKKEGWIDGIKGVGALIIALCWHYQHFPMDYLPSVWHNSLISGIGLHGRYFVEIFFIVSGYGMALGYENKIYEGRISFWDYFGRRIRKIYPLFFETLLLTTVLQIIHKLISGELFIYGNFDLYHFILNVLCVHIGIFTCGYSFNGPSWCISTLLFTYIIFYIVIYKNRDKHDKANLVLHYFIMSIVGFAVLTAELGYPIFNGSMARCVTCFFVGCCLFHIVEIISTKPEKIKAAYGYFGLTVLLICVILTKISPDGYEVWGDVHKTVILGIGPMWILSIKLINWHRSLFASRVLRFFGRYSMAIYLTHFPLQVLISIVNNYFLLNLDFSKNRIWILYSFVILSGSCLNAYIVEKVTVGVKRIYFITLEADEKISRRR